MTITIGLHEYEYELLTPDPQVASCAVRLTSPSGTCYDVAQTPTGWTCECPDYVWRKKEDAGHDCKHVAQVKLLLARLMEVRDETENAV